MLKLSDYIEEKKAAEFFGITARDLRRKIVIDKVWKVGYSRISERIVFYVKKDLEQIINEHSRLTA
jgi:hypothetical protein